MPTTTNNTMPTTTNNTVPTTSNNTVPTTTNNTMPTYRRSACGSVNEGPLEFEDIMPDNPRDYDKMAPPKGGNDPITVYFHVTVMSLDSIDESSMTYAADIFFAQSWKDWRLRLPDNMTHEYRLLPVAWLKDIWRPDSFFKNAKAVTFQEMTIPNHYIWLYQDNTILYMVKLTLVLSCAMNFQMYPHDTQECHMKIESREYSRVPVNPKEKSHTKGDVYPLPRLQEIIDQFGAAKYFSTLDAKSAYWAIPVAEKDREKTAFSYGGPTYQFMRMPFGIKTAPSSFQRVINYILNPVLGRHSLACLDDVVIYSRMFDEHLRDLIETLTLLD
ncbi:gamma-aminobutyric acid receptor subunit delta-like [Procambarus clarkii]|uniref:gamma-aminobutyric acid receptor subunit delta-like n=1 Tax=Procambarus clarkii TaxID=6728 RepID=UPI003743B427